MTSFSILLNGAPSRLFTPSRGLRQGDSLSPFLFVLMMEGLGRAIKIAKAEGRIQGIKLTLHGAANTHQQFVDNKMLQGLPTVTEAKTIKQILNDFAMAASIEVSLNKSKVFFFNTDISIQRNITRILGFQRDQLPSKSLNLVGRLVLTHVVLQAIPIFMFSTLPAPKGVKQQIRSIKRDFLWGKGEVNKKWALVAWDKIYKPKSHSGLGLHDLETINKVSGAKFWWRWIKELATPWAKLWKQKYAKNWQEKDPIRMSGHIKGSHIWNLAWENKSIVQQHSFWEIRARNLARFWEDN
eukprot:PITA_10385